MKLPVGLSLPSLLLGLLCWQSVSGELLREHLADHPTSVGGPRAEFKNDLRNVDKLVIDDRVVQRVSPSSPERRRADNDDSRQVKVEAGKQLLPPRTTIHLQNSADGVDGSGTLSDFPCPIAADIFPCVCSYDANLNVDLDCTLVESQEQLANVFQQEFPVKELRGFNMRENNAIKVLSNILNGVSFESVELYPWNFTLEEISDYFLLSSKDSLRSLRIHNSQLTSGHFPFAVLAVMKNLQEIFIVGSSITWIPKILAPNPSIININVGKTEIIESGTFPIHAESLSLWLINNNISIVEPGSFYWADESSLSSHEELYINLYGNRLESLEARTFVFRDGPMTVWLGGNERLASFAPGTFVLPPTTDSFSLVLSLYNNGMETFDENVFGELMPYVIDLRLEKNPLLCNCDIAWIVINENYMSVIDSAATCADGVNLHDLDPAIYGAACGQLEETSSRSQSAKRLSTSGLTRERARVN